MQGSTDTEERAGRPQRPWLRPFAVWFLIVAIFIGSHTAFYFQKRHYEVGDEAANALQIRNAKSFRELYGNYSRWGFHHPGPAWFYAYAFAEVLLHDATRIAPVPFNAHLLMGVMLQAFFFTCAVTIAQAHVRNRVLTPLLLVLGGLHFGIANYNFPDSIFQSLWPPHVLTMPFLCFLVAGASVASGNRRHLVPLVLSGAMLVHGHVAQPLFVVPLAILACVGPLVIRGTRETYPLFWMLHGSSVRRGIVLAILAIFLLPLGIDLALGKDSNLRIIFDYFATSSGERKTFAQSALYFAAFLCYVRSPERYCDQLSSASFAFLRERAEFLILWSVVALAAVVLLRRRHKLAEHDTRFARWLCIFFGSAVALTLVWGKMQTGEMFAFNSHFNFGLLFVPFILVGIGASSLRLFQRRYAQPFFYAASVPMLVLTTKNLDLRSDFPSLANDNSALNTEARRAARRDRQPSKTKYLIFEHGLWPVATGVAIALERYGYEFRVGPEWAFMFGKRNVADIGKVLPAGEVAVWRLHRPVPPETRVILPALATIDPAGAAISFAGEGANARHFVMTGWDVSTGPYSWSTEPKGLIYFTAARAVTDVEIDLHVFPAELPGKEFQRMKVAFNDGPPHHFEVWRESVLTMRISAEEWNRRSHGILAFEFLDARSRADAGVSADRRRISCAFTLITFRSATGGE